MSFGGFRSLQLRLAVRLAILYVAAAAIAGHGKFPRTIGAGNQLPSGSLT